MMNQFTVSINVVDCLVNTLGYVCIYVKCIKPHLVGFSRQGKRLAKMACHCFLLHRDLEISLPNTDQHQLFLQMQTSANLIAMVPSRGTIGILLNMNK